ncbi:MAG: TonB-dependent receptor [Flavobacteriaceae bacterium]
MLKQKITLITLIIYTLNSFSQVTNYKGIVKDQQGNPIPLVNISVKNTDLGTTSDFDGLFEIEATSQASLVFQYVGFKTQTILLSDQKSLEITMEKSTWALDEITIVSYRDQEQINEIPTTVSVIEPAKIAELGEFSPTMAQVVATVPGVSLSNNTTQTRGQNIRGRNMLVLVDGIPQSTPLFVTNRDLNTIDSDVIERVEIIKGATSIYGNGAEGGVINYITKSGPEEDSFESYTKIGTSGSLVDTDGTIGSEISQYFSGKSNKLSYYVGGSYESTGIMRTASNEISSPRYGLGETERYNAFVKLDYEINDKNGLELMYNYFSSNQNSNLVAQSGAYGETPATGVYGQTDPREEDQGTRFNHNLKLTYSSEDIFKNTNLDLSTYYQDFSTVYGYYDTYYVDLEDGYEGGQSEVISTKMGLRANFNTRYELGQITGNFIYGLDVLSDETAQPLVDGRSYTPPMDMSNIAPYMQIKANLGDLIFKGGMRYENIVVRVDDYTTLYQENPGAAPTGGDFIKGDNLDYNAFVFNAGLRYNKIDAFKPYASFSQSFSVGQLGRILRGATDENAIQDKIGTEPVISNNYELGFVSDPLPWLRFQAVGYISTSELGVNFVENPETLILEPVRNPERIYGGEFQADAKINSKMDAGVSYSYIEGKTDTNDDGTYNKYLDGDRIAPGIFRANLSYKFNDRLKGTLFGTYSGNRDRFEADENGIYAKNQGPVNSFFTTDLFSSYQMNKSTTLVLGIQNLLNKDYYPVHAQSTAKGNEYIKANGINFNLSVNIKI